MAKKMYEDKNMDISDIRRTLKNFVGYVSIAICAWKRRHNVHQLPRIGEDLSRVGLNVYFHSILPETLNCFVKKSKPKVNPLAIA